MFMFVVRMSVSATLIGKSNGVGLAGPEDMKALRPASIGVDVAPGEIIPVAFIRIKLSFDGDKMLQGAVAVHTKLGVMTQVSEVAAVLLDML